MLPAGPTDHLASVLLQARRPSVGSSAVQRFADMLPGRPLATDDFRAGSWPMLRSQALRAREIAPDPEGWLTALRFDVDATDGATRWLDAEMPPPNIIVTNPRNGHAHYTYFLARWVRSENERAVRYADAVRSAMTAALRSDPAYSGRFTHNPLHDAFAATSPRSEPYTLDDFATYLDLDVPAQRGASEISTLGRNCEAFDRVRQWAYNVVGGFKREGSELEFAAVIRQRVEVVNDKFPVPLPECEVRSISKSIAGWCWHVYRSRDPKARERRQAAWGAREAARRDKRAAEGRSRQVLLEQMLERRRTIADLTDAGRSVSEIVAITGLSRRHVQRLRAARGMAAGTGETRSGSMPKAQQPGPEGTRPNGVFLSAAKGAPSVPTPSELAREAQPPSERPSRVEHRFVALSGSFMNSASWRDRLHTGQLSQRRGRRSSSHPP